MALTEEMRQMEELTEHCTLRRHEDDWAGPDGELGREVSKKTQRTLNAYREQPILVEEHANLEQDTAHGGYQHRQLFELVQNSADALWSDDSPRGVDGRQTPPADRGRIEVRLTEDYLYCADDGEPIDLEGMKAIMFSHLSPKRATSQIGTFGLGFKALLGVSDAPEFFSRSGSFRFDRDRARQRIREVVPDAERCPVLRLPEPIDPVNCWETDEAPRDLMAWAVNIVRLPLRPGARDDLRLQMMEFPPEFLLFVAHVGSLTLIDDSGLGSRVLALEKIDDDYLLADGDATTQWRLFERTHRLSRDARADQRPGDDRAEVSIWWAAPVDRLNRPGKFWAFFPTATPSLVPGVLNAPWKTNEDRQNLLPGNYNEGLIEAAAELIAESLAKLRTTEDPARHLDALPRRHERGDSWAAELLREHLVGAAYSHPIVPNQDGDLQRIGDLQFPPRELTPSSGVRVDPLEIWARHPGRPKNWLHHSALKGNRLPAINRVHEASRPTPWAEPQVPRSSIAEWLDALVKEAVPGEEVSASSAAIRAAAALPKDVRASGNLGQIVRTATGGWSDPDPHALFLPVESAVASDAAAPESTVHPELAADEETLAALKDLGLKQPSPEVRFRAIANRVLAEPGRAHTDHDLLDEFWTASRSLLHAAHAFAIISKHDRWRCRLQVRTRAGDWAPLHSVLMPGAIVSGDGSRDNHATVDVEFHESDPDLLDAAGVKEAPFVGCAVGESPLFERYRREVIQQYRAQDHLPANPQEDLLGFSMISSVGPLDVLTNLSPEASAAYTWSILSLDAIFECWEMSHKTRLIYPKMACESLPIWLLRKYGQVKTPAGIVPLADALGPQPASPAALHALLRHPNAEKIKQAFELADPVPEVFGEGEPTPLTDVWPGLRDHLSAQQKDAQLVLCEEILVTGTERPCAAHGNDVYLLGGVEDDERAALEHVADALGLNLGTDTISEILERRTPAEIEERHEAVRRCSSDAARLLAAVSEARLRKDLPPSLLAVLEDGGQSLSPIEVAEAAIATFHTGALRQFRSALDRLGPPKQWAGSPRAVAFVRSLGLSDEWAGAPKPKRPAYLEVEGPRSLPTLHDYQRGVAAKVRGMLRGEGGVGRRGMLSMPTGSGKTRVAVQAIVEAVRDDGFPGGVLWVADRDELCEQAVEAWAQVWRSEGSEAAQLRISRLWSRQPKPLPTAENHVVVASIQTLRSRLSNRQTEYGFLKDFQLLVCDEAHRSIAPSYTSVMEEIGLTYRQREDEPFLIGLTATPYRKHDEEETSRLVRRYGNTRLDAGAFASDDPETVVTQLQGMGVLAQADNELIEGGTFQLRPEEWEEISRFVRNPERSEHLLAWLPQTVEDRIAHSVE
ncbi:MAG: DEAD/DEAH box helicase, partial [Acidimicrobiia bacterium]|nr:DEAD/DEAH box helicase [Acidimicrobiia bacterium]